MGKNALKYSNLNVKKQYSNVQNVILGSKSQNLSKPVFLQPDYDLQKRITLSFSYERHRERHLLPPIWLYCTVDIG